MTPFEAPNQGLAGKLPLFKFGFWNDLTVATLLTIAFSIAQPALAQSPLPLPPINLGQTSFLDGEALPGGLAEINLSGTYAGHIDDNSGNRLAGKNETQSIVALLHFAYVSQLTALGGYLGAETLLPISHVRTDYGNFPNRSTTGLADITVAPFIQWNDGLAFGRPMNVRAALQLTAPTGPYSANQLVNLGANAWQVSPYLAVTVRPAQRWEISVRGTYDWSGRNTDPPDMLQSKSAQAGDALAVNWAVSREVSEQLRLGISGYALWQLRETRLDNQPVIGSRERVYGVGPGFTLARGKNRVVGNVYSEFGARNRPTGTTVVFRYMRGF